MIKPAALKDIYLFKNLTPAELDKVAALCTNDEFISGQDVFSIGQAANAFYVVQQGTIKIVRNMSDGDEVQLMTVATGSHFGEMPLLNGDKRSATAQAAETSKLISVPFKELQKLLDAEPVIASKVYREMAKYLASRLQHTTDDLSQAREMRLKHF